jgi:hypothetical protein
MQDYSHEEKKNMEGSLALHLVVSVSVKLEDINNQRNRNRWLMKGRFIAFVLNNGGLSFSRDEFMDDT